MVIIQMGGNDHRIPNEISGQNYYNAYVDLVNDIHTIWPNASVVLMVCSKLRTPVHHDHGSQ